MLRVATLVSVFLLPISVGVAAQEQWSLARDLRIGAIDGPTALTQVGGLAVGADGSMYIAQPQEQLVRVFDRHGRFVRTIGRRGNGPGEFLSVATLGMKADTLWVGDRSGRRLTLLSPRGEVHRTVTVLPGWSTAVGDLLFPGALLNEGSVIGVAGIAQGSAHSTSYATRRLSRDGRVLDTIFLRPIGNETLVLESPGGGRAVIYSPQPFDDSPLVAIRPDGSGLVVVGRQAASRGEAARFFVTHVGPRGDTIYSRGFRYAPRPLPRRIADSAIAELAGHAVSGGAVSSRARAEQMVRSRIYLPDHWPPVETVVAGRDGTVWLKRETDGRTNVPWLVLDAQGRILANLTIPGHLRVLAAQRDTVWALEHDADDVPYVVRYRVVRGGGR